MESKNEVLTLRNLGLTPNQVRVYLALYQSGLSTAEKIAKNSGIARSDVYRVVPMLEKMGLVERLISVPCKFRAISIHDAFAILMERRMKETSELQVATRYILEKLKTNNTRIASDETKDRFSLVPEQAAVRKKKRTLKNVQRNLDIITSWIYPDAIVFVDMEDVTDALQRGVEIRVIIDKPEKGEVSLKIMKQLKNYPNFEIRWLVDTPEALMSLYDEEEAWIYTGIDPRLKEFPTLCTNNHCLLSIFIDYFERMWKESACI